MTEYLEDTPTWGQRDYRLYPSQYGDPFYRGRGRGRSRGRGRWEWFNKRPIERSHGGLGRRSSHVNGREISQVPTMRTQQERQEEGWSEPSNMERREDERERHESLRAPPAPPPTEDQFFMDWSSVDSPIVQLQGLQCNLKVRQYNLDQSQQELKQWGISLVML